MSLFGAGTSCCQKWRQMMYLYFQDENCYLAIFFILWQLVLEKYQLKLAAESKGFNITYADSEGGIEDKELISSKTVTTLS